MIDGLTRLDIHRSTVDNRRPMPPFLWRVCAIACLTALVVAGIDWGLPSPASDAFLFATRAPWDGRALAAFDADRIDTDLGADVDRSPVARSPGPTVLTATDADRAALLRRYRLYSSQPDEMNTFMALQQMRPGEGQLDPRMYKYGGVWVYGVGAMLRTAAALGWIELNTSTAFYYDRPDAFGRFYVIARLYTVGGYVLAMTMAAMAARRLAGDEIAAASAAAVVGLLPVVFAMAHEAKPHLGGGAVVLAAALAGARYARTARVGDAAWCGALAGLAAGTVVSAAVAAAVPLTMVLLPRRHPWATDDSFRRRAGALAVALSSAAAVFCVTNPYVVLHAVRHDAVLASTVSNSQAFYAVGDAGALLQNGARRLLDALSWPAVLLAVVGGLAAVTRRQTLSPLAILLTVPAVLALVPFFAFAAGQPADYARFALLPAMAVGLVGVWALATIRRRWLRAIALAVTPLALLVVGTGPYVIAFAADATAGGTRAQAAAVLRQAAGGTLQVTAEPAPYCLPPVDLWAWRVVLTSPGAPPIGDAVVRAIDDPAALGPVPIGYCRTVIGDDRPAPITWANKPFEILMRERPASP